MVLVGVSLVFLPAGWVEGGRYSSGEGNDYCVRCWDIVDRCVANAEAKYRECIREVLLDFAGCKEDCDDIPDGPARWICYALCAEISREGKNTCDATRDRRMERCDLARQSCRDMGCEEP